MDKTYVFDNADGGCSNNGMMGLLASLSFQPLRYGRKL